MKSLEILSFTGSTMEELPIEMGQLTQLKLLDLYYCRIKRIPPGVLSSLSNLEELYVGHVTGALLEHMTELCSLSNLVALDISLNCNELWPMNWTLENVKSFHIRVGNGYHGGFWLKWYLLPNALYLEGIDVPNIMESGLRMPLKISRHLCLVSIQDLNNDFFEENYDGLTELVLVDCENIEYLINAASGNPEKALPVLKSLILKRLQNFKQIYQVQSQKDSLSKVKVALTNIEKLDLSFMENLMEIWPEAFHVPLKLRELRIAMCPLLNSVLLPSNWMQCNLEEIYVKDCQSVEVLFDLQEFGHLYSDHDGEGTSSGVLCLFPRLKVLSLISLPKFRSLCPQDFTFVGTCLEEFTAGYYANTVQYYFDNANEVEIVPSAIDTHLLDRKVALKDIEELVLSFMDNLMEIWPKAFHIPLKLRRLRIEMCPLLNGVLLPFNWIQCGLEEIYVKDFQSVEVVFDLQIFGHPYSIVALPMLDKLKIRHLPKLIHVWKIYTISPVSFKVFKTYNP